MTKESYLSELRARLSGLPEEDVEEALEFCGEVFEDAPDEASALDTLGSPQRMAAQLRADAAAQKMASAPASPYDAPEEPAAAPTAPAPFPDYSARPAAPPAPKPFPTYDYSRPAAGKAAPAGAAAAAQTRTTAQTPAGSEYSGSPRRGSVSAIWYILGGICALPSALPLLIVVLVLVAVLLAVCLAIAAACIGVVVALFAGCAAAAVYGITHLAVSGVGALSIGAALVLLGLAMMLVPLVAAFLVWLCRAVGKLLAGLWSKLKTKADKTNENR